MLHKKILEKGVWKDTGYYFQAREASLNVRHPGMVLLNKLAKEVKSILDLGCGEGSRLNLIGSSSQELVGVDISETAIKMAKAVYPSIRFIRSDLETIKLPDKFDLVYSAYVLEHLDKPELVLDKAIDLVAPKGYLLLLAPNFGAPNRASPLFKGNRVRKLLLGLKNDFFSNRRLELDWNKVKPLSDQSAYHQDWDTVVEPYLGTLISFLRRKNMGILEASSCWDQELKAITFSQILFRIFGWLGIYPFWMWGPHILVLAKKDK